MTDRFMIDDAGTLIDIETREMYDIVEQVCPIMNDLNNEKTRLYEDNIRVKQLITEAYNNERTQIGRNTLKQLLEQI